MQQWIVAPEIRADAELAELVRKSNETIGQVVEGRDIQVSWRLEPVAGVNRLHLWMVQPWHAAHAVVGIDELRHPERLRDAALEKVRELEEARSRKFESLNLWRDRLRRLFDRIREWIVYLDPVPFVTQEPLQLREADTAYLVDELKLVQPSGREMTVRPVGRQVLAGDGRVDILGADGPYVLILDAARDEWFWHPQTLGDKPRALTRELFLWMAEGCFK